jgi:epoxide hydrolase 4
MNSSNLHDDLFRHEYMQIGGVRLHYVLTGKADRLIVLLHGFPECWYSWRHQLKALKDVFTVVAPDLRGYNLSNKPSRIEDYKINAVAEDILGLIRHLRFSKAAIVGHDWGAAIAWYIAFNYPEYLSKMVSMQVPPLQLWRKNMSIEQALRSWYMLFFQLPFVPEWLLRLKDFAAIEWLFKYSTIQLGAITDADIAIYKEALKQPGALNASINYYRANISTFFNRRKEENINNHKRVKVPTLFIYGEEDVAITPTTVQGIRDYIDAPYKEVRIPWSGHWVQQEAAALVNQELKSFLQA